MGLNCDVLIADQPELVVDLAHAASQVAAQSHADAARSNLVQRDRDGKARVNAARQQSTTWSLDDDSPRDCRNGIVPRAR